MLHLHNNNRTNLTTYPDILLDRLKNVEFLSLDGFPGAQFREVFSGMTKLQTLHIYGGLDAVLEDTFTSFGNSSISELSLKTGISLHHVEPSGFSHLSALTTLDLGYNQKLGLRNVSNAWWGLQFTNITQLVLTAIASTDDQPASHSTSAFFKFL